MKRICPECGRRFNEHVLRCPDDGNPTFIVEQQDSLIGKNLDGRFTIVELIGKGGMGAVYKAKQHSMDRHVALKVLKAGLSEDAESVKRFFREAKAASRLSSPHVVTVIDFGQTSDGTLYLAMELLRGKPLSKELFDMKGPMDPERAVRIIVQVLDALDEAHASNIIHRDLKPDNVFLLEGRGAEDFVKVLDFGIAKIADPAADRLTKTGVTFGTPTYMSPEQALARQVTPLSDLYSAGVILFEMVAGKPPFEEDTPLAMALKKAQEDPPTVYKVNPEVKIPGALDRVIRRMLSRTLSDRPQSAREAKEALLKAMEEPGEPTTPPAVLIHRTTELVPRVSELSEQEGKETAEDSEAIDLALGRGRKGKKWWVGAILGVGIMVGAVVYMVAGPSSSSKTGVVPVSSTPQTHRTSSGGKQQPVAAPPSHDAEVASDPGGSAIAGEDTSKADTARLVSTIQPPEPVLRARGDARKLERKKSARLRRKRRKAGRKTHKKLTPEELTIDKLLKKGSTGPATDLKLK